MHGHKDRKNPRFHRKRLKVRSLLQLRALAKRHPAAYLRTGSTVRIKKCPGEVNESFSASVVHTFVPEVSSSSARGTLWYLRSHAILSLIGTGSVAAAA